MKPFYFYHVIDKDADISLGLLSLQYMYDHKMYKEFDENTSKYRERIVSTWNIPLYKNRSASSLTREEILNALQIFRGSNGSRCIYFVRYPFI